MLLAQPGRPLRPRADLVRAQARTTTSTSTIVDRDGDDVRELVDDRESPRAGASARALGRPRRRRAARARRHATAPRLVLRAPGPRRSLRRATSASTRRRPTPRVTVDRARAGRGPRPELLPRRDGEPAQIRFSAPGRSASRSRSGGPTAAPRLDDRARPRARSRRASASATWDGTRRRPPRRARARSSSSSARATSAGNIGSVAAATPLAPARRGATLPGRGGITVRYLARRSRRSCPSRAGEPGRGRRRRARRDVQLERCAASASRARRAAGAARSGGPFRVRAAERRERPVPLRGAHARRAARASRSPSTTARDNRVLVVLPATTWQGRNPVDDDGDGAAQHARPRRARCGSTACSPRRPAAGLRRERGARCSPTSTASGLRYDLTTDVALAVGRGPADRGPPRRAARRRHRLADRGRAPRAARVRRAAAGTLASLGTDSLRREVRQTPRRLLDPTPPAPDDLFGSRLEPLVRSAADLTVDDDEIELFRGDVFGGTACSPRLRAFEPVAPRRGAACSRGDDRGRRTRRSSRRASAAASSSGPASRAPDADVGAGQRERAGRRDLDPAEDG